MIRALIFALVLGAWGSLYAQEVEDAPGDQRGIAVAPAEETVEEVAQPVLPIDRTRVLPPAPSWTDEGQLLTLPSVHVREIRLDGPGLLPAETVQRITQPYLGREVSFEELTALKHELSLAYFDLGLVNSGVELPDQEVTDGVIAFREVSGRLTEVALSGNRALDEQFWLSRIETSTQEPLQINALQETLQLIEQGPLVRRIEAQLLPGLAAGESRLELAVEENRPWQVNLGFNNHRSPSLGGEQLVVEARHFSLTGRADELEFIARQADGLGDYRMAYSAQLNRHETRLSAWYATGDAEIVEAPFDVIDIDSKTRTAGISISHPLQRSLAQSVSVFFGIESLHSETTLLGFPFSFSLGEINGEADATALVLGLEWSRRSADRFMALQLSARKGVDWLDARVSDFTPPGLNGPPVSYQSYRGQLQFVQRLAWRNSELHARASFQLAGDPLLPVEKMPVGGALSVRGFRENLLVRDNALVASMEWRVPLFIPEAGADLEPRKNLSLALFADIGQSWDHNTGLPSDDRERISSAGLGLLWRPGPRFSADLYYGHDINGAPGVGSDLQDDGWHFSLNYAF